MPHTANPRSAKLHSRAGTGRSARYDGREAGAEAAAAAVRRLHGRVPNAVIVFATVGYPPGELVAGVRSAIPDDTVLVGCSAEGVIEDHVSDEGSHAVVVIALSSDTIQFTPVYHPHFGGHEEQTANAIADQVDACADAKLLMLLTDGLTGNCTRLVETLDSRLPEVTVAGGTASDMMQFERTWQYIGDSVHSDGVVGLVFSGRVRADVTVSHGCAPVGKERTITRAEGPCVQEVDGGPAWSLFRDDIGERDTMDAEDIIHLCVGRRLGEHATEDYGDYVIRVPLGKHDHTGAMLFPGELPEGTVIRLTRREPSRVVNAARRAAQRLNTAAPSAFLVLQFDCAGRGRLLFGDRVAEHILQPVRESIPTGAPLVGFHTFGEIAPIGQHTFYHNYTVVLVALSDDS